jgi:hypothetical protein
MAAYLIGYDLNRPGQDYQQLFEAIKSLTGTHWRLLDSTWIIQHNGPATVIRDFIQQHIDSNDKLLVVKLSGEAAWYGFTQKGTEWLKSVLGAA